MALYFSSDLLLKSAVIAHQINTLSEEKYNEGVIYDGLIKYNGSVQTGSGKYSELSINGGELLYFKGYCYGDAFPVVTFFNGNTLVGRVFQSKGYHYGNIVAPQNANKVIVNSDVSPVVAIVPHNGVYDERKTTNQFIADSLNNLSNLKGRNIVWFGTSIPAGGYIGANVTRNYPSYIAKKFGCTIYNEAVGSSSAHCKELASINEINPYGFNTNFELSSRCLTNTINEMQWIIDHFNDNFWTSKPGFLSDQTKNEILSFSYENKLDKYLSPTTFPDLFVFDHGYNDYVAPVDNYTGHEYELNTLQGALNFLIRRIYNYNPNAKILIIANYKYQTRNGLVVQAQEAVAKRWNIPIFDTWKYTGLSDEQAYTNFTWSKVNNAWVKQTCDAYLEKINDILLPDKVHPHSRPDDLIINRMANAIGRYMNEHITFDD